MKLLMRKLIGFALRETARQGMGATATVISERLKRHFTDGSLALPNALQLAYERAWVVIDLAVEGNSLRGRWRRLWHDQTLKGLVTPVERYLQQQPPTFRKSCAQQLAKLRKAQKIVENILPNQDLAAEIIDFSRYTEGPQLVQKAAAALREGLQDWQPQAPELSALLTAPIDGNLPLFLVAFEFFVRQEISRQPQLASEWQLQQIQALETDQKEGFAALARGFDEQLLEVNAHLAAQHRDLQSILQWLNQIDATQGPVKPQHSFSLVHRKEEVLQLIDGIPLGESPMLDNAVGKLLIAIGEQTRAKELFAQLAESDVLRGQRLDQGQIAYNYFRIALEQRQWEEAQLALLQAVKWAPELFAPFDLRRYELRRILGAGAFGIAFECYHRYLGDRIVIKSLNITHLNRPISEVFNEARLLRQLDHPAIIRIEEFDFVDYANQRPYLVMRYFDGISLENYLSQHQDHLSVQDALGLGIAILEGLQVAHAKGILHRDIKPDNILVRFHEGRWAIKIIDFGLALSQPTIHKTTQISVIHNHSILANAVAGTIKYAPPEQMGELNYPIGPYSDLYSWAKTLCAALFGHANPTYREWQQLGAPEFVSLLNACLERHPQKRPQKTDNILADLRALSPDSSATRGASSQVNLAEIETRLRRELTDQIRCEVEAELLRKSNPIQPTPPSPRPSAPHQKPTISPSLDDITGWDPSAVQALQKQTAQSLGYAIPFCDGLRNGLSGPKLTIIPAGRGTIGSPKNEMGRQHDEKLHQIALEKSFAMGIYAITFDEFDAFCAANQRPFCEDNGWGRGKQPVICVNWLDATEFCVWLSEQTGKIYRLPTEAEWEYACRAGTQTPFWWGKSIDVGQANYNGTTRYGNGPTGQSRARTIAVDQFRPNPWGLYQMSGNVCEWTGSLYKSDWDGSELQSAPRLDMGQRVLRGGTWHDSPAKLRSAARLREESLFRTNGWGFRVVREL